MTSVISALRTGDFLDRARVRRIAVVYLVAVLVSFAVLLATSDGLKDRMGRPLGTDFMAFYVAGTIAAEQGGAAAYDAHRQYKEHQALLREETPRFWPYLYPPAFLFVVTGLAAFPYLAAWLIWMGATLSLYAAAMQKLAPGVYGALLALAFPPVYTNFLHGQNAFLIAALFAGALAALFSSRMIVAGLAFGLIAIKPQYGVLIPIALAAGGHWRAFAAAAAAVVALAAIPTIAFGADVWAGFLETLRLSRIEVVEAGAIGFEKIQSVFAQARFLGANVAVAYAAQAAAAIVAAVVVFRLWRSQAPAEIKAAGLIIASTVATPYVVDYDLVVLAPALAFLIRDGLARGFLPFEKTTYLFAAFAPVIARPVGMATHVSMGLAAAIALLWIVWRRAREAGAEKP